MSLISDQWLIDGQDFGPPSNWEDFEIEGTFSRETDDNLFLENQANLTIENLEFTGAAAEYISNRHKDGLTGGRGAFQGSTVSWVMGNKNGSFTGFSGYIDYTDNYRESQFKGPNRTLPNKVVVKIVDTYGLNSLLNQIEGLTVDLFSDTFTDDDWVDIPFVVVKKYDYTELMMMSLSLYIFKNEIKSAIDRISKIFADLAGGITGPLVFGLKLAFELVYIGFLVIQLIALMKDIINLMYSKLRHHKGVTLRTIFTKGFEYLGYKFISPITQLDNTTILPTLPTKKSNFIEELFNKVRVTETGLPSINDWGFLFVENLTTGRRLYNARLAVINNNGVKEVHLRTDADNWWFKQSNLTLLNDVLIDEVGYNASELKRDIYVKFLTDSTDEWTKEEKKGTSFETITSSSPRPDNGGIPLEKGIDEILIPYALGVRKGDLTVLEKSILGVASAAQAVINFLGGNVNFKQDIKNRTNALKISNYEINQAKLLWIDETGIPANHRDLLSAEVVAGFHRSKSFVNASDTGPYNNQYQTFEGVRIKFDLDKFLQLKQNSYFITDQGESGKITKFVWNRAANRGTFDGRIRFVYDKSLTERTIELKNSEDV